MSLTGFTTSSVGAETYDFVEPASSSELFAIVDEVRLHVSPLHPQFSLSYIAQMHCAHHLLAHADMHVPQGRPNFRLGAFTTDPNLVLGAG